MNMQDVSREKRRVSQRPAQIKNMDQSPIENPRAGLFVDWSESYDQDVQQSAGKFPFDGYPQVLETVLRAAALVPGMTVLELGPGSGNLTRRLVQAGCQVWGLDFSSKMLDIARTKAPRAVLLRADILGEWPAELAGLTFDRVLSTYLFHEFKLAAKLELARRIMADWLKPGGRLVIGDIGFPEGAARAATLARWPDEWDDDEEFWSAESDLPAFQSIGLRGRHVQVSSCGAVFVFECQANDDQPTSRESDP